MTKQNRPRIRANSARTEEHRNRILDAAADCFMRNGFEAATIDDIAATIGATKGLIYYSFKSKDDLFFAVYETAIQRALLELKPITSTPDSGLARLNAACERHVATLMERLPYHVVTRIGIESHAFRAMTPKQRQLLRDLKKLRDDYEKVFADMIREGIADGSIRPIDVSLAAKTVIGAINSVSMWYRPRASDTAVERGTIARQIADMVTGGLTRPPHQP